MKRLVLVLMLASLPSLNAMSAASGSAQGQAKKSLPLDRFPNVVLKSPENSHYLPGRIILKLMQGAGEARGTMGTGIGSIDEVLARVSVSRTEPMFPPAMAQRGRGDVDLSRFVVVHYTAPANPFSVAQELSLLAEVQYAEPWFIYPLDYTPNDPSYASQYGLTKIEADAAWTLPRETQRS